MGIAPTLPASARPHRSNKPRSLSHHRHHKPTTDPTIHLHIGACTPPIYMSTHQSRLTSASKVLHRHLRAQVPDPREYSTRDKTMKMRNELPETVGCFLQFLEKGSYSLPATTHEEGEKVREHLRVYVFATKYEIPRLAAYARRRAGAVLEERVGEGWGRIYEDVLRGVEEREKEVMKEVLGRLVAPVVWRASGEW